MLVLGPLDHVEYHVRRAWLHFKRRFGFTTHVDKNFYALDAAMRLRFGTLPPGVEMTCAGRSDGAGMQALARMSGYAFASAFGTTYVDTPFQRVDHSDRPMPDWARAWEDLFNLAAGERTSVGRDGDVLDYPDYLDDPSRLGPGTILRFQQCHWLGRRHPAIYLGVVDMFRRKFGTSRRPAAGEPLRIAIHVRRGDVTARRTSGRYTPDRIVLAKIGAIRAVLGHLGHPFELAVHSQGHSDDFAAYAALGCALHLDRDALWTMRELAEADVLMMSKSSFSFVAALIGHGVKLYEPCRNTPVPGWIRCDRSGLFEPEQLRARIRQLRWEPERPHGSREPRIVEGPARA